MATVTHYAVQRAHSVLRNDTGEVVWLTRENEHLISTMLTVGQIAERVANGAITSYEVDEPLSSHGAGKRRAKE